MPVHKVKGGYKWGKSGKAYLTKEQAEEQGKAIESSKHSNKKKKGK